MRMRSASAAGLIPHMRATLKGRGGEVWASDDGSHPHMRATLKVASAITTKVCVLSHPAHAGYVEGHRAG